jgi:cell cycle sensor histidine kinase DivJ
VIDTGIGIAAADVPKLMQPFVQLDNVYERKFQGAGLGLAMVRSLVERHGGVIDIESETGRGTKVTVRLPVDPVAPAAGCNRAPGGPL